MLEKGLEFTSNIEVDHQRTAVAAGSGDMEVFATPWMAALMENAAMNAVKDHLPEGSSTVGTSLHISHDRATPVGEKVSAKAVLIAVEGRRLSFEISAQDSKGIIGKGSHERFIVDRDRFLSKL